MKTVLKISFGSLLLATVVGCTTSTQKVSANHKPGAWVIDLNDARLFYEMGRFDAAEQKLEGVLRKKPNNPIAIHLLVMVEKERYRRESQPRGYYPTIPPQPIY